MLKRTMRPLSYTLFFSLSLGAGGGNDASAAVRKEARVKWNQFIIKTDPAVTIVSLFNGSYVPAGLYPSEALVLLWEYTADKYEKSLKDGDKDTAIKYLTLQSHALKSVLNKNWASEIEPAKIRHLEKTIEDNATHDPSPANARTIEALALILRWYAQSDEEEVDTQSPAEAVSGPPHENMRSGRKSMKLLGQLRDEKERSQTDADEDLLPEEAVSRPPLENMRRGRKSMKLLGQLRDQNESEQEDASAPAFVLNQWGGYGRGKDVSLWNEDLLPEEDSFHSPLERTGGGKDTDWLKKLAGENKQEQENANPSEKENDESDVPQSEDGANVAQIRASETVKKSAHERVKGRSVGISDADIALVVTRYREWTKENPDQSGIAKWCTEMGMQLNPKRSGISIRSIIGRTKGWELKDGVVVNKNKPSALNMRQGSILEAAYKKWDNSQQSFVAFCKQMADQFTQESQTNKPYTGLQIDAYLRNRKIHMTKLKKDQKLQEARLLSKREERELDSDPSESGDPAKRRK